MNKKWWIVGAAIVVIGVLGFAGYRYLGSRQQARAEAQAAMETAVVRRDTLRVTLDATGSLAPRDEVSLAFASKGREQASHRGRAGLPGGAGAVRRL